MSRSLLAVTTLAVVGCCLVAFVKAQEPGGAFGAGGYPPSATSSRRVPQRNSMAERLQSIRTASQPSDTVSASPPQTFDPSPSSPPAFQIATPRPVSSVPSEQTPVAEPPVATETPSGLQRTDAPATSAFSSRRTPTVTRTLPPAEEPVADRILVSRSPNLRIEGEGPQSVIIGKPANYTITVKNDGEQDSGEVVLSIAMPKTAQLTNVQASQGTPQQTTDQEGIGRIIWQLERVPARGTQQITLVLTPQTSQPFELGVDWAFRPPSTSVRVDVLQPRLEMQLVGPKEILFGKTQPYTIVLSNPGTGDAENVTLMLAPLSEGQAPSKPQRVGLLRAGETREFPIELQASQAGALKVRSIASADGGLKAEVAETITVRRAEIGLEIAGTRFVYAPGGATYQIAVGNAGDAPAQNLTLAVTLPKGAKYLGGIDGAQSTPDGLRIPIGDLRPNDGRRFSFQCELTVEGQNQVQVVAKADAGLSQSAATATQVETVADLKLTVNDPQGPIPVGEKVAYEVIVRNRGAKAAQGVKVVAQFIEGIAPSSAEGGAHTIDGAQVHFQPIPRINPNEQVKLVIYAQGTLPGTHTFRVELTSQNPEGRLVAEDTSLFFGDDAGNPVNSTSSGTALPGNGIFPR
ncbi:COG1361 family protein [Lignipirellula cremea]|uniref:Large cysteine-rich periplasmic protein OmcB n=1 Tax=Lignipirellula cremea TaxID=2528010 RepID=A0A518DRM2_9BACT|nr:DUF11 domain-containing protein [Lignipirellula cremea]QDU94464.1 Large cysteine-rich periplasmic protein OmcB precursor [Lignipirellula cremea]